MKARNLPNIDDLYDYGFEKCGSIIMEQDDGLKFEISSKHNNIVNVLYAFATRAMVGYIGITEGRLLTRFNKGYTQTVYDGIKTQIIGKASVEILFYSPKATKYETVNEKYDSINVTDIDMPCGLEIPLQKKFKTQWTTKGYGGFKRLIEPIIEEMFDKIMRKNATNAKL